MYVTYVSWLHDHHFQHAFHYFVFYAFLYCTFVLYFFVQEDITVMLIVYLGICARFWRYPYHTKDNFHHLRSIL